MSSRPSRAAGTDARLVRTVKARRACLHVGKRIGDGLQVGIGNVLRVEPSEAVAAAESALREAVRLVLPQWSTAAGAPPSGRLTEKRKEDVKRRDGTLVADDLLAYTETHHLRDLIVGNWERFKPVFDDLERTRTFLALLLDYRNPVAHSRELVGFERDLLAGVSGQIRNQVALYRTRNEPSNAHYPLIESVTDNFGQKLLSQAQVAHTVNTPREQIRLNVGDRLQFRCRGWDVQDRPLTWCFRAALGGGLWMAKPLVVLSGKHVTFTVTVSELWVGEQIDVGVSLASSSRYHRHMPESGLEDLAFTFYDDEVFTDYAVNPPRGR